MISIIIPTLNREKDLLQTLIYLDKQVIQSKFEVIIVDQSEESTSFPEFDFICKYFHCPDWKSASRARNLGLSEADNEIVLFLDDDVIIENPWFLFNHLRHYINNSVVGVSGCIIEINQKTVDSRHYLSRLSNIGWMLFPRQYDKSTFVVDGGIGNLSVRKNIALRIGAMDENFEKGAHREESDFNFRLKKEGIIVFDANADLVHIGNPVGGIRSWKRSALKSEQHFIGSNYFAIKNLHGFAYGFHQLLALRYFVFNQELFRSGEILVGLKIFVQTWFKAKKMYHEK